jgi:hypothetical protein
MSDPHAARELFPEAIRESLWRSLGALAPPVLERMATDLYAALVETRPTAAAILGKLDAETRARKLAAALRVLSMAAHDRQRLGATAIGLGARHARRGILRDDYLAFAEILAGMLAERQDAVPVATARAFWMLEFAAIIEVMIIVDSD